MPLPQLNRCLTFTITMCRITPITVEVFECWISKRSSCKAIIIWARAYESFKPVMQIMASWPSMCTVIVGFFGPPIIECPETGVLVALPCGLLLNAASFAAGLLIEPLPIESDSCDLSLEAMTWLFRSLIWPSADCSLLCSSLMYAIASPNKDALSICCQKIRSTFLTFNSTREETNQTEKWFM